MITALNPKRGRAFEQTPRGFDCYTFERALPFDQGERKLVLLHRDEIVGIAASLEDAYEWLHGGKVVLAPPPIKETLEVRAFAKRNGVPVDQVVCFRSEIVGVNHPILELP